MEYFSFLSLKLACPRYAVKTWQSAVESVSTLWRAEVVVICDLQQESINCVGGRRGSMVSTPKKFQLNYGTSGKNHAHQIVECSFAFWAWSVWGQITNSQRNGDQYSAV